MHRSSTQVSSVSHKAHMHPQMWLVSMGGAPGISPLWIYWNRQLSKPTYLDPSPSASVSRNFSLECPHESHCICSLRLLEHSASRFLADIQVDCLLQTWDMIPHDESQGVSMSIALLQRGQRKLISPWPSRSYPTPWFMTHSSTFKVSNLPPPQPSFTVRLPSDYSQKHFFFMEPHKHIIPPSIIIQNNLHILRSLT